ncbi:hypothetical protein [Azospirillum sp. SYSU D00513]|uniref:hypothetical protein n=1 Tax=Azospirillum sp. SYSU D00513 TaxID=2812561 RepID=UPI001A961F0F|nr:hypothetical protein [Azospirillum sp. SYSU D00513]
MSDKAYHFDKALHLYYELVSALGHNGANSVWQAVLETQKLKGNAHSLFKKPGRPRGARNYNDLEMYWMCNRIRTERPDEPLHSVYKETAKHFFDLKGKKAGASVDAIAKRLSRGYAECLVHEAMAYLDMNVIHPGRVHPDRLQWSRELLRKHWSRRESRDKDKNPERVKVHGVP